MTDGGGLGTPETRHRVHVGDARDLPLAEDSVELVVTSPPYPMVDIWDDAFAAMDEQVGEALDAGRGDRAFDLMHRTLEAAWDEVARVLVPGGIACVNVGDAVRTLDRFKRYPNAAAVTEAFRDRGFDPLPEVVWRKPSNGPTKFMGSGTRPPNAYVTHEHESILVFRNGAARRPDPERRDRSAHFWEERNEWFSDLWELRGDRQSIPERDRAAAYPLEVPYRLVNMYSVRGETVLDPFLGTGTTTAAAMASARHSVGVERDPALLDAVERRVEGAPEFAAERNAQRVENHRAVAAEREMAHESATYDFPVMTSAERELRLPSVERVVEEAAADRAWRAEHGVYRP